MEKYVNLCRSASSLPASQDGGDDGFEGTLKVPASVLDGCGESFTAADERRKKASTQFFSDTGLMALLCRHDHVLWLANMTSAGEKQYYALTLVKKLFENIPSNLTVGLLYDIACQLHRSFVKHNFLPRYQARLFFGLSVFHAYGHQWPCQVIYHPRKCTGFGLSDGEGCERFWSSIRKLIPTLRVSGVSRILTNCIDLQIVAPQQFHQRLHILETQARHICQASLTKMGDWLTRKWYRCQELKHDAQYELDKIGIPISALRHHWLQQIQAQTRPAPRAFFSFMHHARILELCRTIQACRQARSRNNHAIGTKP